MEKFHDKFTPFPDALYCVLEKVTYVSVPEGTLTVEERLDLRRRIWRLVNRYIKKRKEIKDGWKENKNES